MWICPNCHRPFRSPNQWHICGEKTIDEIFERTTDDVILAFDDLLVATADWEPNLVTPARKAVMFTNKRAWAVVRPLKTKLDISFFGDQPMTGAFIHKSAPDSMGKKKYRHQIRLSGPGELTGEMVDALRTGWEYGMR